MLHNFSDSFCLQRSLGGLRSVERDVKTLDRHSLRVSSAPDTLQAEDFVRSVGRVAIGVGLCSLLIGTQLVSLFGCR